MPITRFPDPRKTTSEGILALGGDLHPESLLLAYRQGIFPWPIEDAPLAWFSPPKRAILVFDEIHLPRSLERARKKAPYRYTINEAFVQVIIACSEVPRPGQDGTWIVPGMIDAYVDFHELGYAKSVEVWEGEKLVGGIYGVEIDGFFAGESMFYRKPNASKLALLHLVEHLRTQGLSWMDIQVMTPHMAALGAREIKRDKFLEMLAEAQAKFKVRGT